MTQKPQIWASIGNDFWTEKAFQFSQMGTLLDLVISILISHYPRIWIGGMPEFEKMLK